MEREISDCGSGLGLCTGPGQARGEAAEETLKKISVGDERRSSQGEEENHRSNRVEEE